MKMPRLPTSGVTIRTLAIYWLLVRITVPIAVLAEVLSRAGFIDAIAPAFAPVMGYVGLPPELGLAWLTAMLVGLWAAVPLIFTLVPLSELTAADMTVFGALILFAHALPVEQKILQKAGAGMAATTLLRVGGGLLYAVILHTIFEATGWLAHPVEPTWVPMADLPDWTAFFAGLAEAMVWMLVILLALSWAIEWLRKSGLLHQLMKAIAPVLKLAGIREEAAHLTTVGLLLGISYGAGLLIDEARSGRVSPRQIFLSCVFMGFAHSVIEDTLIVVALGADAFGVVVGRLVFALLATAIIAMILRSLPDKTFYSLLFQREPQAIS